MTIFWVLMAHGHYLMMTASGSTNWLGSPVLFGADLVLLLLNLRFSLTAPSSSKLE